MFDWSGDSVVIHEQPATAIYFNPRGALVIQQCGWPDEDPSVYIAQNIIQAFLERLCDICRIPSMGRSK